MASTDRPPLAGYDTAARQPSGLRAVRPAIRGWVHSTEAGGAVDGPGIRHVLFLSGCMLRCRYCHNPDTWHMHKGKPTTSREVLREIAGYAKFLIHAKGGVTLTGGEPLVQPDFVAAILRGCKEMGLHTALDTAGFLGTHADDYLLADVDLVLLDIKAFSEETYRALTGVALQPTLDFAERLAAMNKPVWLRYVLVPGGHRHRRGDRGPRGLCRETRQHRTRRRAALPQDGRVQMESRGPRLHPRRHPPPEPRPHRKDPRHLQSPRPQRRLRRPVGCGERSELHRRRRMSSLDLDARSIVPRGEGPAPRWARPVHFISFNAPYGAPPRTPPAAEGAISAAGRIEGRGSRQRMTRAPLPFMIASTSFALTIEVSPGVVMASAPCAAPYSTAACGPLPSMKP